MTVSQLREEYRKIRPPENLRERIEALDEAPGRKKRPSNKMWAAGLGLAACLVLVLFLALSRSSPGEEMRFTMYSGETPVDKEGVIVDTELVSYGGEVSLFEGQDCATPESATTEEERRTCCVLHLRSNVLTTLTVSEGGFLWYDEAKDQVFLRGDKLSLQGEEDIWLLLPEDQEEILLTVTAENMACTYRIARDSDGTYTAVLTSEETIQEGTNP